MAPKGLKTFTEVKNWNESQLCTVPGCTQHRDSLSRLCRRHLRRLDCYGHVNGGPIKPREIARTWLRESHRLVHKNKSGPSIIAFSNWLRATINLALEDDGKVAGAKWWREMTAADPIDVLILAAGIYLAAECGRLSQIKDERSLWTAIANVCVFQWTRGHRHLGRVPSQTRRDVAEYLRRHLMPLMEAFKRAIEAEQTARENHYAILSQPLDVDDPIRLAELEAQRAKREASRKRKEKAQDAAGNPEEPPSELPGAGSEG
jgi:hypothetical protein